MIERHLLASILDRLGEMPAVVLLGPRQSGKTTLALETARRTGALYLDLESERDRARLSEPELYLEQNLGRLVILDEIHRVPGLFPALRVMIDRARRSGNRTGRYLLLGSASLDLMRQSGETLAGRVSYLELSPFDLLEVGGTGCGMNGLWLRGGFPDSFLAGSDASSYRWRMDFIRSYLERDLPQFGSRIPAERIRRFWTMLAHGQGGLLNTSQLARNIGMDVKTASSYIDLLVDLLLVRRLQPWHANSGKRLVRSPRVYVRDSGLVHSLLALRDMDSLLSHPVVGSSWEGFVIEQAASVAPEGTRLFFYRTGGGAEADLVLALPGDEKWVVEIKRTLTPRLERGFLSALDDLQPARSFLAFPGDESYPLGHGVLAVPLPELMRLVSAAAAK